MKNIKNNSHDLEKIIKRHISVFGPMTVAQYMSLALTHPQYGYYTNHNPFGKDGDFVTSPEISQMFGEILGAWIAHSWQTIDKPKPFRIVELGPGRGTLMNDALRSASLQKGFCSSSSLHLVEISEKLIKLQENNINGFDIPINWHDSFTDVPSGPMILIANEFFDALPIHQFEKTKQGWNERLIDIDQEDNFHFVLSSTNISNSITLSQDIISAPIGSVVETCPYGISLAAELASRVIKNGGAILIIDYGANLTIPQESWQSVYKHKYHSPLKNPGKSDISAHVNFQSLKESAIETGARVLGPIPQGTFLENLGIKSRADFLKKKSTHKQAKEINNAYHRLVDSEDMGFLFQVLCISSPNFPHPAGF